MKRMSFDDYSAKAKSCGLKKAKDKDAYEGMSDEEYAEHMAEMEEDEDEGDNAAKPDDSEKSEDAAFPDEEELMKSLEKLVEIANDTETAQKANRLAELAKSASEGGLSPEDTAELRFLLETDEGAGETLQKSLFDDEDVVGAMEFDASGLIKSLVEGMTDSIGTLGEEISSFRGSQERFDRYMAKSMMDLAKSLTGALKAVNSKLDATTRRLTELEALPLDWRGRVNVKKSDIQQSPRDGLDPDLLKKSGSVTKQQAQRVLFDLLNKSQDESERSMLLDVSLHLDAHKGDWRECALIVDNPALVKRITENLG